jgi:hypothetical protein
MTRPKPGGSSCPLRPLALVLLVTAHRPIIRRLLESMGVAGYMPRRSKIVPTFTFDLAETDGKCRAWFWRVTLRRIVLRAGVTELRIPSLVL